MSISSFQNETFQKFFKELNEAQKLDQDAYLAKMEDFPKIIYENLETINQSDIAMAISTLFNQIKSSKRGMSSLLNQMILIMNDLFDAFPPQAMSKDLQDHFLGTLAEMEKLLRSNASNLSMETLTNAAYYYCKF